MGVEFTHEWPFDLLSAHLQFAACKMRRFTVSQVLDHVFGENEGEDTVQHNEEEDNVEYHPEDTSDKSDEEVAGAEAAPAERF